MRSFLTHIEQNRGNDATTRNSRLAAIKAFMRYVEFRVPSALDQIRQIHAIPTKRHDQALVSHLTMDEVRAILDAPNLSTRLGIRDRAMLHVCFACGLRVSELVGLQLEQVSLHRPASIRVRGKGRAQLRFVSSLHLHAPSFARNADRRACGFAVGGRGN